MARRKLTFIRQLSTAQSMTEYALIIALLALTGVAAWSTLGGKMTSVVSSVASHI